MNDCQVQVMMMVSAEDKQAAGEALKQCALGAGGSSLCDGVLDDDGKPTDAFKAEMKQCGMKAMMLCPLQVMTLSSSLMSIQDDLKNGGKLDSSTMTSIWNQVKSAFACLKTKKDRLPENCQFLSDEHLADGLFNGDDDSDTKKSGGGGGG